jgi:hypothetical protein
MKTLSEAIITYENRESQGNHEDFVARDVSRYLRQRGYVIIRQHWLNELKDVKNKIQFMLDDC